MMAKKKEHYGVYIIVGIVIVFAVALIYFGGNTIGQAGKRPQVSEYEHCITEAQQMKDKLLEMEKIGKTIAPRKYEDYAKLLVKCQSLQPPASEQRVERPAELPVEQRAERPSPPEVPVAEEQLGMVYEQVLCYFKNSGGVIKCVPSGFSDGCQAYSPPVCIADVKGPKGSKISWKSECGVTSTVIDGRVKLAVFECPVQPAVPAPTVPVMLPPEVCRPGMPCPVMPGR